MANGRLEVEEVEKAGARRDTESFGIEGTPAEIENSACGTPGAIRRHTRTAWHCVAHSVPVGFLSNTQLLTS